MNLVRRALWLVLAVVAAGTAAGQDYPDRPVRIVVGYAPGGGVDLLARLVAQRLGENLKQSVIVENRPGASGTIGAGLVAQAAPDGHTLLACNNAEVTLLQHVLGKLPYDPSRDLAPLVLATSAPTVLVVHPSVPAGNARELLALARARGGLPYGTPGPGSVAHIAFELLRAESAVPFTHVPYKGGAPAVADLVSGQLPVALITSPAIIGHIRAGKARPLAVLQKERSGLLPEVPTFKEATGIESSDAPSWFGFMAPARTPPEIRARLEREIRAILAEPDVRAKLGGAALDVLALPADTMAARMREETSASEQAIRRVGMKFD